MDFSEKPNSFFGAVALKSEAAPYLARLPAGCFDARVLKALERLGFIKNKKLRTYW